MNKLIDEIIEECRPYTATGKVASYIPELSKADPRDFGIYSPALDAKGNSVAGVRALALLSSRLGLSIF